MQVLTTVDGVREVVREFRAGREMVALVPTMGALHAGHLALVREAATVADRVIVSLFVNPTQFGPGEDLSRYPRDLEGDIDTLRTKVSVDVLFAPKVEEIYPEGSEEQLTSVSVDRLDEHLCGPHRPGHFQGVATVVAKLFGICTPDVAVFGLKDAQQFVIIERMVRDLNLGVRLIGVPTVREHDGLAMSSRNVYLTSQERSQAPALYGAVSYAGSLIATGERNGQSVVTGMRRVLEERAPSGRIQYAELVDTRLLQPVASLESGTEVLAAVAVYFGQTRLIDSMFTTVP